MGNFVEYLLFNLSVPLLWFTVLRNVSIVVTITHWLACVFWWEAREVAFDAEVLSGVAAAFMSTLQPFEQYLMSLYWAVTTLSMVRSRLLGACTYI